MSIRIRHLVFYTAAIAVHFNAKNWKVPYLISYYNQFSWLFLSSKIDQKVPAGVIWPWTFWWEIRKVHSRTGLGTGTGNQGWRAGAILKAAPKLLAPNTTGKSRSKRVRRWREQGCGVTWFFGGAAPTPPLKFARRLQMQFNFLVNLAQGGASWSQSCPSKRRFSHFFSASKAPQPLRNFNGTSGTGSDSSENLSKKRLLE